MVKPSRLNSCIKQKERRGMELLTKYNYAIKLRVELACPDTYYVIGPRNPAIGTKYECVGTIVSIDSPHHVRVKWDNGNTNQYKENELSVVDEDNVGRCTTIW